MIPDWIQWDKKRGMYITELETAQCDICHTVWYPRINRIGVLKIGTCPDCKNPKWNGKND